MKHAKLLVVEDDVGIQEMLDYSLKQEGYEIHSAYI